MNKTPIDKYKPYQGFYDLRDFKLSDKLFRQLWKIQDTLHEMSENQEYYKKWHPIQWEKAKGISGQYQLLLLGHAQQGN